jgi:hypothetical protein
LARVKPVSTIAKPAWKKNIRKPHKRTQTKLMPVLFFPTWSDISDKEGAPGVPDDISEVLPVIVPAGSPEEASSAKASLGKIINVINAIKRIDKKIVLFLLELILNIKFSFQY